MACGGSDCPGGICGICCTNGEEPRSSNIFLSVPSLSSGQAHCCSTSSSDAASQAACLAGWIKRREVHAFWGLNLTLVGLVFLTHPQQSLHKDGEHTALGLAIVVGAHFLVRFSLTMYCLISCWRVHDSFPRCACMLFIFLLLLSFV